jgi:uncharacterized protein (DUF433 family)
MTDNSYNKLLNRVVSDPKIGGGEPCIRGTRIRVTVILDSLAEGLSPTEILKHFPPLTAPDVEAALVYAQQKH